MTGDHGQDSDDGSDVVPPWGTAPAVPEETDGSAGIPAWGTPPPPRARGLRALAQSWRDSRGAKAFTAAVAAALVLVGVGVATGQTAGTPPTAVAQPVVEAGPVVADQGDITFLEDLEPGDCAEAGPKGAAGLVLVDCGGPHDEEVIGAVNLKPGPWTGDDAVEQQARAACAPLFARYVGVTVDESSYFLGVYDPNEQAWSIGFRTFTCVVEVDADTTGSVKGARL